MSKPDCTETSTDYRVPSGEQVLGKEPEEDAVHNNKILYFLVVNNKFGSGVTVRQVDADKL